MAFDNARFTLGFSLGLTIGICISFGVVVLHLRDPSSLQNPFGMTLFEQPARRPNPSGQIAAGQHPLLATFTPSTTLTHGLPRFVSLPDWLLSRGNVNEESWDRIRSHAQSVPELDLVHWTKFKVAGTILVRRHNCIISNGIKSGGWEPVELQLFSLVFNAVYGIGGNIPGLLDVGTNLGWFSFNWALWGGRSLGFEAMGENAAMLASTIASNYQNKWLDINVVFRAVSHKPNGSICIKATNAQSNSGNGFISFKQMNSGIAQGNCPQSTPMTSLDHGLYTPGQVNSTWLTSRFVMAKVDVEEGEPNVIVGASRLLHDADRKPCVWLIESWRNSKELGRTVVCDKLREAHYDLYHLSGTVHPCVHGPLNVEQACPTVAGSEPNRGPNNLVALALQERADCQQLQGKVPHCEKGFV